MILRLVRKVRSTGSFLEKKHTRQNAVLTEEMLDETGATLEHSPRKSLARLTQQAQVSKTTEQHGQQLKTYIYGHIK
jgi:hypothetical protein